MVMLLWLLACGGGTQSERPPRSTPERAERTPRPKPAVVGERPENVLIVLADDLGTDKVGAYGAHPDAPPTPHIDALAARGVRFDHAYSTPACSPTRAALLTGRQGRRTGVGSVVFQRRDPEGLPRSEVLIPEMLSLASQDWSTVALGKWHLAVEEHPDYERDALRQGFDHYAGALNNVTTTRKRKDGDKASYKKWEKTVDGKTDWTTVYATTDTVNDALAKIAELPEPWFVYMALNAIHEPFEVPPAELVPGMKRPPKSERGIVDAMVQATDTELGRLFEAVDFDDTTVVFVSDNGTTEVGIAPPWDPDRSKLTLYDGGCRVPFVVAGPRVARPGSSSDALVHVVDLFPTVADIAGVALADVKRPDGTQVPIDGQSLLPLLAHPEAPGRAVMYVDKFQPNGRGLKRTLDRRMIRDREYKLIRTSKGDELFAYAAGRWDEGPNLLQGTLTAEQQAAYDALSARLEPITRRLERDVAVPD